MTARKSLFALAVAALVLAGGFVAFGPARAELRQGARAPLFATQGALAGKPFAFNLATALRQGPVVLYFYPKAFTEGCTLEAHAFAEAMDQFHAARATVIGMSADDIPTLLRFSTQECRDKFPVATATPQVIRAYRVALIHDGLPPGLTSRTSYVIGTDGRIRMVYANLDYRDHVARTLAAVQALHRNP